MMPALDRVLVSHPSKQHSYEVAVALQQHGRLLRFVTGIYDAPASWLWSAARAASAVGGRGAVERMAAKRRHPALDPANVTTWPSYELLSRTVGQSGIMQTLTDGWSGYLSVNWAFDRAVAHALRAGRWQPRAVYAFLGAARQTFAACRQLGIRTVLDVPIILLANETLSEERRALGLAGAGQPTITRDHLRLELEGADHVIAPAPAVARSVELCGYDGPVTEVPFGVDVQSFRPGVVSTRPKTFQLVYVGRIELRKGIHHLIRAWHEAGVAGELVLAGSAGEPEYVRLVRSQYGGTVREAGNLSRGELAELLGTATAFVMPSLAEGSALVTYEALAAGLPSVVTHESGSVVRDGIEGFVVPAGDTGALVHAIRTLHENPALRTRMAAAARARAEEYSWTSYQRRLVAALDSELTPAGSLRSAIA